MKWFGIGFILGLFLATQVLADTFPGGFIETQGVNTRSRLSTAQIAAFMPNNRGAFTFPAPYNTRGLRLTQNNDCAQNQDCLVYVGFAYWANMNNHVASTEIQFYLVFDVTRGGTGMNLFRYNKTTEVVTKVGPVFPAGSLYRNMSCTEGCYFSATLPNKVYFVDTVSSASKTLVRYDVVSQTFETIWDMRDGTVTGCNVQSCGYFIRQPHSSVDDTYHSMTLSDNSGNELGCIVRKTSAPSATIFYPKFAPEFNECSLEKSGRWAISLEFAGPGGQEPSYNRIFDNTTQAEVTRITGPSGTLGHLDTGYNYMVGADNTNPLPNATKLFVFPNSPGQVIHYNPNFNIVAMNHVSHLNARPNIPSAQQVVFGSNSDTQYQYQNEITAVRIDTSQQQMIIAPVMTDPNAVGGAWQGAPYALQPKGNVDVTGHYFIWTSNLGGTRLVAFLVKVPELLLNSVDVTAPAPPVNLQAD